VAATKKDVVIPNDLLQRSSYGHLLVLACRLSNQFAFARRSLSRSIAKMHPNHTFAAATADVLLRPSLVLFSRNFALEFAFTYLIIFFFFSAKKSWAKRHIAL
jgi:hypothetical protein